MANHRIYYGLKLNPFNHSVKVKDAFQTSNYIQMFNRLQYLIEYSGIGIFTGGYGSGKTYALKCFISTLSEIDYDVIYLHNCTYSRFEFYLTIINKLNIDYSRNGYSSDAFHAIQKHISNSAIKNKKRTVLICDNAHQLKQEVIESLPLLMSYGLDDKPYLSIVLIGSDLLLGKLSAPIINRTVVKYEMANMSSDEVRSYITDRLELSKARKEIFESSALEAIINASGGQIRRLNHIIDKCLFFGCIQEKQTIDIELAMQVIKDMEFNCQNRTE